MASAALGAGFFRLEADLIRRSKGHSVIAASAYRMRGELTNERTGEVHDYTRSTNKPLFSGFYAPANAPEWAREAGSFWNQVEIFEKRKDAQLGRDIMIDLPHQMNTDHARFALQDFIRENFTRKGYAVQLDIHPAHEHGDVRNLHAHLIVALRKIEGGEFGKKEQFKGRRPDPENEVSLWREKAAHHINRQLERFEYGLQVDHRSNAERGIDREPTVHLGKTAADMERRGRESERGDINREIYARNAERDRQKRQEIAEERHAVRELHALYGPDLKLDEPELEHVSAIERQQAEDREDRAAAVKEAERDERKAASLPQYVRELLRALRSLGRTMGAELGSLIPNSDRQGLQAAARAEREQALKIVQKRTRNQDVVRDREPRRTTSGEQRLAQAVPQLEAELPTGRSSASVMDRATLRPMDNSPAEAGPKNSIPPATLPEPKQDRETYLDRQKRLAKERGDAEIVFEIERKRERDRGRGIGPGG